MRPIPPLAVLVFLAAAALSAKTAYDLIGGRAMFPSWFVPAFVAGLAALVSYGGFVTLEIWRARETARWPEAGLNSLALVLLSAVLTWWLVLRRAELLD